MERSEDTQASKAGEAIYYIFTFDQRSESSLKTTGTIKIKIKMENKEHPRSPRKKHGRQICKNSLDRVTLRTLNTRNKNEQVVEILVKSWATIQMCSQNHKRPSRSFPTNKQTKTKTNQNYNMKQTSSYVPVNQVDDIDDPPVIIEVVKTMEQVQEESSSQQQQTAVSEWNQVKCAGCVGATVGCLTGGFWLSLLCGSGCAYAAKQHEGMTGNMARACGSFGVKANVMAREVDEQHHVVENSKLAASAVWNKAKTLNRDHQIVQNTKNCVVSGVKAGIEFSKEHRLAERTAQGVGKVISVVSKEIASNSDGNDANNATATESDHTEPEIFMSDRVNDEDCSSAEK